MEALGLLMLFGLIGGGLIALLITRLHVHLRGPAGADAFVRRPLSTDVINMASIKVAGIGGLGMVAVCVVVALTIPVIFLSTSIGLVSGAVLAGYLIRRRRRLGVMPSSGTGMGANTVLRIDSDDAATRSAARTRSGELRSRDLEPGVAPGLS